MEMGTSSGGLGHTWEGSLPHVSQMSAQISHPVRSTPSTTKQSSVPQALPSTLHHCHLVAEGMNWEGL